MAEVVALYPQDYGSAIVLGNLAARRGDREDAIRAFTIAKNEPARGQRAPSHPRRAPEPAGARSAGVAARGPGSLCGVSRGRLSAESPPRAPHRARSSTPSARNVPKRLHRSAGPANLDLVGLRGRSETEVERDERAGEIRRRNPVGLRLGAPVRRDPDPRLERGLPVVAEARLDRDPVSRGQRVAEHADRTVDVDHDEIERAVAVEVRDRRAAARHARAPEVAGVVPLDEAALAEVVHEHGALREAAISRVDVGGRFLAIAAQRAHEPGREVPAHGVEVGPPVVVEVREVGSPAHRRHAQRGDSRRLARVLEQHAVHVAVEAVLLRPEVRHEEAVPPAAEGIAHGDAHPGARLVAEHAGSGFGGHLLEAAAAVLEEAVGNAVVDELEVRPAVAVVVEHRDRERLRLRRRDRESRLGGHVAEPAAALVAEEVRRLPGVVLGNAQLELLLRKLPLRCRVQVVRDGDVEPPVAVVVEKRRAGGKEGVLETRVLALLERPVPAVPPDRVGPDVGQVEVEPAVAVEVGPVRAHAEAAGADAGLLRDVLEPAAAHVAVEPAALARVGLAPARDGVGDVEVGPAVAVEVARGDAADHGRNQLQPREVRPDFHLHSGRTRDVLEDAGLLRRRRRAEREADGRRGERRSLHGCGDADPQGIPELLRAPAAREVLPNELAVRIRLGKRELAVARIVHPVKRQRPDRLPGHRVLVGVLVPAVEDDQVVAHPALRQGRQRAAHRSAAARRRRPS